MGKTKLINCKFCGKEISKTAKVCPGCGAKNKKPFYKTVWFWAIIIFLIIIGSNLNSSNSDTNNSYTTNKKTTVIVVDFSAMTTTEIKAWCATNKIDCNITSEYSNTITNGSFISQNVAANATIYEGDEITIAFSLGVKPTTEQQNALIKAEQYSKTLYMSKQGIYDQLTSEYGEQFSAADAQYAIDNMTADWNANALAKAKSYQTTMNMSKKAIYDQLVSQYGEKFTASEAQYAIDHLDD